MMLAYWETVAVGVGVGVGDGVVLVGDDTVAAVPDPHAESIRAAATMAGSTSDLFNYSPSIQRHLAGASRLSIWRTTPAKKHLRIREPKGA